MAIPIETDGNVVLLGGPRARMLIGQVIRLAHVEIQMDRVERDNRGEQRRVGGTAAAAADQAADGDEVCPHATGKRCHDMREFKVQLSIPDRRLGGVDGSQCAALLGGTLIHVLGGAEFGLLQLPRPPEFRLGERLARLRCVELSDRLIEPDLERPRVDGEQRIALLYDLPVPKGDVGQRATDLRAQFDGVHGRELAEKARRADDRLPQRSADCHLRGRRRRRGRFLAAAPCMLAGEGPKHHRDGSYGDRATPPPSHRRRLGFPGR